MIFLTADPHGDYQYIANFCRNNKTSDKDVIFILGDMELNTGIPTIDSDRKRILSELPITFLCIHGNHEIRPNNISSYEKLTLYGANVLYEKNYKNIFFVNDAEICKIENKTFLIIGGAYSPTRLLDRYSNDLFCDDEQPSDFSLDKIDNLCNSYLNVDFVLSHTCPFKHIPYDACTLPIDQSKVDRTTEKRLQKIYDHLSFSHWYCGHYHTERTTGKVSFLYKSITHV